MHTEDKKRAHGVEAYLTNRLGHATGRGIAKALWSRDWVRAYAARNPEMFRLLGEGLVALTSLLEFGGDHPLVRFANFVLESASMETLELYKEFEANPDDADLAKKVDQKIEAAIDKAEKDIVVAVGHVHKDDKCKVVVEYVRDTTPPARAGKDGKVQTNASAARLYPMPLASALADNTPLCGLCYRAVSVKKADEPQKAQTVVAGRNFMEYVMRLQQESPIAFKRFWDTYMVRINGPDGPDLARKFQDAFNGKHGYEAFRFVIALPDRNDTDGEEWHHALDALVGKVTPNESLKKKIEGFIDEEKQQTKRMFEALFAWIERSNAARAKKISALQASIAERDREWARRKAKPGFWSVRNIVIICMAVVLTALLVMDRVNNPSRSETTEQEVETPNVR